MNAQWTLKSERVVIHTPVLELLEQDRVSSKDGRSHRFYVFHSNDWCNIIPVTADGNVVMINQYRTGIDASTLEIPGGIIDDQDGQFEAAALRELEEETGYAPLPQAQCHALGWTYPNPAIQNNRCHAFVVGPVAKKSEQKLDAGEIIEVTEVPLEAIPEMILSGKIRHALILNTFLLLGLHTPEGAARLREKLAEYKG